MKVLAIFMTLFMLLSGFDFCKDEAVVAGGKEKTEVVKSGNGCPDEKEVCSPFCQCARCPFSVLIPQKQVTAEVYKPLETEFLFTIAGNPTGVSVIVWQPPKLG